MGLVGGGTRRLSQLKYNHRMGGLTKETVHDKGKVALKRLSGRDVRVVVDVTVSRVSKSEITINRLGTYSVRGVSTASTGCVVDRKTAAGRERSVDQGAKVGCTSG